MTPRPEGDQILHRRFQSELQLGHRLQLPQNALHMVLDMGDGLADGVAQAAGFGRADLPTALASTWRAKR